MKRVLIWGVVIVILAGAAVGIWWLVQRQPQATGRLEAGFQSLVERLGLAPMPEPSGLVASGFVEADQVSVSTPIGGRIVALNADEGDEVVQGQVLVRLDDLLLQSQIAAARADVEAAEAGLALLKAGAQAETLNRAQAMVDQAQAAEDAARVAWEDAQLIRDNYQELELAVVAAQAQLGVLSSQEKQAEALANAAQVGRDYAEAALDLAETFEPYDEWVLVGTFHRDELPPGIPLPPGLGDGEYLIGGYKVIVSGNEISVYTKVRIKVPADVREQARVEAALATYQSWQAWTGLAEAEAARGGTAGYLAELTRQQSNPLTAEAQVHAAEAQYRIAQANVAVAQAQVDGLKLGATSEQVAAAEAQVAVARAALRVLETQADQYRLEAPISGLVLERPVRVGELALPGAPQFTLANLDEVTLTIYVPEDQLARVALGWVVSVTVDAYPGRTFAGTVQAIASEAEFTPKNVQTQEERVNMVFAVDVALPNPDHALKPGMPADALVPGPALQDQG